MYMYLTATLFYFTFFWTMQTVSDFNYKIVKLSFLCNDCCYQLYLTWWISNEDKRWGQHHSLVGQAVIRTGAFIFGQVTHFSLAHIWLFKLWYRLLLQPPHISYCFYLALIFCCLNSGIDNAPSIY